MRCIRCRIPVQYNRALVREHDGGTLGGLCSDCEREQFGLILRDGYANSDETCLFCSQPGVVALPVHRIDLDEDGSDGSEIRGFPIDAATPRLCDGHAGKVFSLDPEALRPETSLATYTVDDY